MIIYVKVKPNSKKQKIEVVSSKEYIVSLKNLAENNKANLELLKLLEKYFNKKIKIIKGLKNKKKIIEII